MRHGGEPAGRELARTEQIAESVPHAPALGPQGTGGEPFPHLGEGAHAGTGADRRAERAADRVDRRVGVLTERGAQPPAEVERALQAESREEGRGELGIVRVLAERLDEGRVPVAGADHGGGGVADPAGEGGAAEPGLGHADEAALVERPQPLRPAGRPGRQRAGPPGQLRTAPQVRELLAHPVRDVLDAQHPGTVGAGPGQLGEYRPRLLPEHGVRLLQQRDELGHQCRIHP